MQDGAPAHTANKVKKYLQKNWVKDILWPKEFWPPNSPDLNPLNLWTWSALEAIVHVRRPPSSKEKIVGVWDNVLQKDKVKEVCD